MNTVVIEGALKPVIKKDLEMFDLRILWLNKNVGSNLCYYATEKKVKALIVTLPSFQKVESFLTREHPVIVVCPSTDGLRLSLNVEYVTQTQFYNALKSILEPEKAQVVDIMAPMPVIPKSSPQNDTSIRTGTRVNLQERKSTSSESQSEPLEKKDSFSLEWGSLNWGFEEDKPSSSAKQPPQQNQQKRIKQQKQQQPKIEKLPPRPKPLPVVGFGDDGFFSNFDSPVSVESKKKKKESVIKKKPATSQPSNQFVRPPVVKNEKNPMKSAVDLFPDDDFGISQLPETPPPLQKSEEDSAPSILDVLKSSADAESDSVLTPSRQPISLHDLGDELETNEQEFDQDDPFFITPSPPKKSESEMKEERKKKKKIEWNESKMKDEMETFTNRFGKLLNGQISRTRLRRHSISSIEVKVRLRENMKNRTPLKKKKSHLDRVVKSSEKPLSPISDISGASDIDEDEEHILWESRKKREEEEEEEEEGEEEELEGEGEEEEDEYSRHKRLKKERQQKQQKQQQGRNRTMVDLEGHRKGLLSSPSNIEDGDGEVLFKNEVKETPPSQKRKKKVKSEIANESPLRNQKFDGSSTRPTRTEQQQEEENEEELLDQLFHLFTLQSTSSSSRNRVSRDGKQVELQKLILDSPLIRKINQGVLSLKPGGSSSSSLLEPRQVALIDALLDRVESYLKNLFLLKRAYINPVRPAELLGGTSPPSPSPKAREAQENTEEYRKILTVELHRALFDSVSKFAPQTSVFLRECWKLFGKKSQRRGKQERKVLIKHLHHCIDLVMGFIQRFGRFYRDYHSNFVALMELLKEEKKRNDLFSVFISTKAMDIQGMGGKVVQQYGKIQVFHLSSFLALPILHFPEYAQFLKDTLDLDTEMARERARAKGRAQTIGRDLDGSSQSGSSSASPTCWSKKKRGKTEKSHQILEQWTKKCSYVFLEAVRKMKYVRAKSRFRNLLRPLNGSNGPKISGKPTSPKRRSFVFDCSVTLEDERRKTKKVMIHLLSDCLFVEFLERKDEPIKCLRISRDINFSILSVKNPHVFVLFYPYEDGNERSEGRERNMIFRFICSEERIRDYFVRAIGQLKRR